MIVLTVKVGDIVKIGPDTHVRLDHKTGQRCKLTILTTLSPVLLTDQGMPAKQPPAPLVIDNKLETPAF